MNRLLLAPMEGLLDAALRATLTLSSPGEIAPSATGVSGYDWGVTEFVRITDSCLPARTYLRVSPELANAGRTPGGLPIRVQLLGSDPVRLAQNAARLAQLAPAGVDLNFGCPAPTVNRHRGGAVLLDEPELLYAIVRAVRAALPPSLALSAKMRLGVADPRRAVEAALALEAGGAGLIVVHARTKLDGYRPPAHWAWVGRIADTLRVPVVANGEIWNVADYLRCRSESGVADVMLGRGAVADPFLARRIRTTLGEADFDLDPDTEWALLQGLLADYWGRVRARVQPRHAAGRLKQWLNLLRRGQPRAEALYQSLRARRSVAEVEVVLGASGVALLAPAA